MTDKRRKFPNVDDLTPVEVKMWEGHLAGKTAEEIAESMGVQPVTVKRRMPVIKEKLRSQAYASA